MKLFITCLLVVVGTAAAKTTTTTIAPTTTAPTTTAPTTTAPTTIAPTTTAPTTTAPTTIAPTTTAPTTTAPTTTAPTTEPPTTEPLTKAPTTAMPLPVPKVGIWSVVEKKIRCIMVDMAAQIEVTEDGKVIDKLNLDPKANATGTCSGVQYIQWTDNSVKGWSLKYSFEETKDKDAKFFLKNITMKNSLDDSAMLTLDDTAGASLKNSYRCNASSVYNLVGDKFNVTLSLTNLMLQAYRTTNSTTFDEAVPCAADKTGASNIVPIAVGAALAGLVVIVLIAYLIGRRQNRQGYESV